MTCQKPRSFPGAEHVFWRKSKLADRGHRLILPYEEFNIGAYILFLGQEQKA